MIVMKFGGTSVGSAERIRGVVERLRERLERQPLAVVSALSGTTDQLIRGARASAGRDPAGLAGIEAIRERHLSVIDELFGPGERRERVLAAAEGIFRELRTLGTGVQYLGELSPRSLDAIASVGERLASEIVAEAVAGAGLPARALDARRLVVTDESFGRAAPLMEETSTCVREAIGPLLARGVVPVIAGFIGATRQGVTTTLGRGGSDWSASLLGAALGAEEIQIWTDVNGLMTVDPRVVPGAQALAEATFDEAAELAYFGAKVLHPATIKPAVERGIPVRVLNSLNPSAPGTLIAARAASGPGAPRAIAFKTGITVVLISQPRMLMAHGFVARVFEVFDRHRTPVDLIATSEVSVSLTVDNTDALSAIVEELGGLGEVRVLPDMAIVCVVGTGFSGRAGLAGRIFQALRQVNVVMISFGASDVNVSFVVAGSDAAAAVRLLHREFFEPARPATA
jgi:aspartate kinase